MGDKLPTERNIRDWVDAACDTPLDIECFQEKIDGKNLFIISIPPSPYLRETTKQLETPSQTFSQHVSLIRHNESIFPASKKERDVIRNAKEKYFASQQQVPAKFLGAILGIFLGGAFYGPNTEKLGIQGWLAVIGTIVSLCVGAGTGWVLGKLMSDVFEIRMRWHKFSKMKQIGLITFTVVIIIIYGVLIFR